MEKIMRVCFLLQVRPERLEEYKLRHQNVWPEMLDALRQTGWKNYSLFARPDGLLIGYVETDDFEKSRAEMQNFPINEVWQEQMKDFFMIPDGAAADASMAPLEEVFHLD